MDRGIFHFIWRHSARDQLTLVALSAAALPLLYFTFDLPKTIVNQAIGGEGGFPREIFGQSVEQIPYLLILCGTFLGLVLINLGFKYLTSTYRYRVGDRLLRRLRFDLVERLMRFPPQELRNTSIGQVVSMVTAETSPLGFFIAEAFAVPAVALGTLATIVLFMFVQDWMMGVAAIALIPLQLYLIPKFQKRINTLQREEVQAVRQISQRVGDVVAGAGEIHGHDTSQYELADFSKRLGAVFKTRVEISSNRYVVNILNTFFSQLTPFFFLSIGGTLVIKGDISLGALVAVLAAYKDMYAPFKDLIDYYQKAADARVKYDQLKEFFEPPALLDRAILVAEPGTDALTGGSLTISNLVVESDDGMRPVDGASVTLALPVHAVVIAGGGSGGDEFAQALARRIIPSAGRVAAADLDIAAQPDSVIGRRIGYVGTQTHLPGGTLREALIYPLLHRPLGATVDDEDTREAARAGNSTMSPGGDWIDYAAAGCDGPAALTERMIEVLRIVGLDQEVYEIGLRRPIDLAAQGDFAARLIAAREIFHERSQHEGLGGFIEPFDADKYLLNASVAENILFGTPVGPYFAVGNLGRNEFVLKVIQEVVLSRAFLEKGRKLAATMIDIFRDLAPGHEFFSRFSFISGEDLPAFEAILRRADQNGIDGLDGEDRARLMALPFKLIVNQHHVGLIDADMQTRLLHARKVFAQALPPELRGMVQIFDAKTYNAASSIADNVIFGKIATNRADSAPVIGRLLSDVLDELNLRAGVIEAGLGMDIGVGGARLTVAQRQKLVLARTLLKRPDILVLSDALAAIDPAEQDAVLARISGSMAGRSLFLIEPNDRRAAYFEHVLRMDRGRITQAEGARTAQAADAEPAAEGGDVGLNEIVGILQRIPLFSGIDRSKLKLLAFTSDHAAFDRGQFVFKQGDRGDNAYVIIDGEVDVVLESIGGPRIVAVLGRDQVFGEMALLSNVPRTTSIRARGPMKAVVITSDVFLRLIEENSAIAANMMRTLAARLATTLQNYGKVSASHDLMTELPSQRVFLETARLAQASRKRSGKQTAIMLFDLGALSAAVKQIARDEIPSAFKQAAQRMRACLRGGDILAHLRDTQYGVILTEFAGEQDARAAAQRIAGAMRAPFKVGGQSVDLAFSIEFRVVPLDEGQVTQTLERCRSEDATTFVLAS